MLLLGAMDAPRFVPGFSPDLPSGDALWAPFRGSDVLVKWLDTEEERQRAAAEGRRLDARGRLLRTTEIEALGLTFARSLFAGKIGDTPCIAAELPDGAPDLEGHRFGGLRQAYGWLAPGEFDAACLAFQITHWERSHRFCAGCGAPLTSKTTERAKRCEPCARDFYPPVVPAIIVRVERGDAILMTRQSRFPKGMYGLVAGFLEPGETLEGCVAREVLEETGVRVKNVRYFGSQPWPFPHQIMIGFTAEHAEGEIVVDTTELEEAVWSRRNAMPMLPPPLSIARQLVDDWLSP